MNNLLADGRSVKLSVGLADGRDSILENGGPSETRPHQALYKITANEIQAKPRSVIEEEGLQEELEILQEELEVVQDEQVLQEELIEQGLLQGKRDSLRENQDIEHEEQEALHEERMVSHEEQKVSREEQTILHEVRRATSSAADLQTGTRKFSSMFFDSVLGKENEYMEDVADMNEEDSGEDSFFTCVGDP
jgi:hypothetical protein